MTPLDIEKLLRKAFSIEDKNHRYTPNEEWREFYIQEVLPLFIIFTELVETEVNER